MCRPLGFQGCFNLRPVADATGKDVSPSGLGKISVPALLLLDGSISLASLEVNLQSNVMGCSHAVGEPPNLEIDESLANALGWERQSGYQRMPAEC